MCVHYNKLVAHNLNRIPLLPPVTLKHCTILLTFNSPSCLIICYNIDVSISPYDEWASSLNQFIFLLCCVPLLTAQPSISCVREKRGKLEVIGKETNLVTEGRRTKKRGGYLIIRARADVMKRSEVGRETDREKGQKNERKSKKWRWKGKNILTEESTQFEFQSQYQIVKYEPGEACPETVGSNI